METEKVSDIKTGLYGCGLISLIAVTLLSIVIISEISSQFSQKKERYNLFCEEIKTGMSESEVLSTMNKFGKFEIAKYDRNENTTILVVPSSGTTSKKYGDGSLELNFEKKLLGDVIERHHLEDGIYEVCKQ